MEDVDQLQRVTYALLLEGKVDEGLEGGLEVVGLAAEGDELSVLIVQH